MKSDLKPLFNDNVLLKYADNITLLVPEYFTVDIATEFRHTQAWAAANKLCLNTQKTIRDCVAPTPGPISLHAIAT